MNGNTNGNSNGNKNNMSGKEMTAAATALAIAMADRYSETELLLLCAFFYQLSDSIKRILLQDELLHKYFLL